MATLGTEREKRKAVLSLSRHPSSIFSLFLLLPFTALTPLSLCSILDLWVEFRERLSEQGVYTTSINDILSFYLFYFIKCLNKYMHSSNHALSKYLNVSAHTTQLVKHAPLNTRYLAECEHKHTTYNFTVSFPHTTRCSLAAPLKPEYPIWVR